MINKKCLTYFNNSCIQLGVESLPNAKTNKSEYLIVINDTTYKQIDITDFNKECPEIYLKSYSDFWEFLQKFGIEKFLGSVKELYGNAELFNQLKIIAEIKQRILNDFKKYIESILISGSFVKEHYSSEKDIDLMVIIDDITYDIPLSQKTELTTSLTQFIQKIPLSHPSLNPFDISVKFNSEVFKGFNSNDVPIINFLKDAFFVFDKGYWKRQKNYLLLGLLSIPYNTLEERLINNGNALVNLIPRELGKFFKFNVYDGVVMLVQGLLLHFKIYPKQPQAIAEQLKIIRNVPKNKVNELIKLWEEFYDDIKLLNNPSVLGVELSVDKYLAKIKIAEKIRKIVNELVDEINE